MRCNSLCATGVVWWTWVMPLQSSAYKERWIRSTPHSGSKTLRMHTTQGCFFFSLRLYINITWIYIRVVWSWERAQQPYPVAQRNQLHKMEGGYTRQVGGAIVYAENGRIRIHSGGPDDGRAWLGAGKKKERLAWLAGYQNEKRALSSVTPGRTGGSRRRLREARLKCMDRAGYGTARRRWMSLLPSGLSQVIRVLCGATILLPLATSSTPANIPTYLISFPCFRGQIVCIHLLAIYMPEDRRLIGFHLRDIYWSKEKGMSTGVEGRLNNDRRRQRM